MSSSLTLYIRHGCHLCEDLQNQLVPLLAQAGQELTIIDISYQPELEARFGELIPLLMAGDEEICRYFLDLKALHKYMSNQ